MRPSTLFRSLLIVGTAALLQACGGSDIGPRVSQVQAKTLQYGQTATIYIAGEFMRTDMLVDSGSCTGPSFGADSTPSLLLLNCKVTAVGDVPITVKTAAGDVLFTASVTVPLPQVTFVTSKGNVVMELRPDVVPTTVNNFLAYVNTGFYTSTLFHRVIPGFVIQGGGYGTGLGYKEGTTAPIALESNKGLRNTLGTVAMARAPEPDTATSQFFINLADNTALDYASPQSPGYAVFGTVVKGMDVVDAIAAEPTHTVGGFLDVPITEVKTTIAVQTQ